MQQAISVFADRGFIPREHQLRNVLLDVPNHVIAIGTSGGKTVTTAAKLEFEYKFGYIKPDQKSLILAADKTILRSNFVDQFADFFKDIPASFTWCAVASRKELEKALEDNIQVIITLPQTICSSEALGLMSQFDFKKFVQDEAHKWYFRNTIRTIIQTLNPTHQILLTGTPFDFNRENQSPTGMRFHIDYTSVRDLYEAGYLSDVSVQVLHTNVPLTKIDYTELLGDLKSETRIDTKVLHREFEQVIKQMIKKLKIPFKDLVSTNNITKDSISVFGKLQKSIVFAHGIPEADSLYEHLKQMGVGVLVSHSKNDIESTSVFEQFKVDPDIKVLVAVQQGREGFDFARLYNIVDMTFTQNFALAMQMIGRVLRKDKNIKCKYFFKVAPKDTAGYWVNWMNALFMLFDTEWYSRYNGKNGFDIEIPNSLLSNQSARESDSRERGSRGSRKNSINPRNLDNFYSLSFMKDNKWFKLNDVLSSVAYTTLGNVVDVHRRSQPNMVCAIETFENKYDKSLIYHKESLINEVIKSNDFDKCNLSAGYVVKMFTFLNEYKILGTYGTPGGLNGFTHILNQEIIPKVCNHLMNKYSVDFFGIKIVDKDVILTNFIAEYHKYAHPSDRDTFALSAAKKYLNDFDVTDALSKNEPVLPYRGNLYKLAIRPALYNYIKSTTDLEKVYSYDDMKSYIEPLINSPKYAFMSGAFGDRTMSHEWRGYLKKQLGASKFKELGYKKADATKRDRYGSDLAGVKKKEWTKEDKVAAGERFAKYAKKGGAAANSLYVKCPDGHVTTKPSSVTYCKNRGLDHNKCVVVETNTDKLV